MWCIKKNCLSNLIVSNLPVAGRVAAAIIGGYALAHTLPIALFAVLPLVRAEAALFAIQLSFVVYVVAVLWAFAARSAWQAWIGLLVPALLSGALGWVVL